jgi:hypothetical protein
MILIIPILVWLATNSALWAIIAFCVLTMIEDLPKNK